MVARRYCPLIGFTVRVIFTYTSQPNWQSFDGSYIAIVYSSLWFWQHAVVVLLMVMGLRNKEYYFIIMIGRGSVCTCTGFFKNWSKIQGINAVAINYELISKIAPSMPRLCMLAQTLAIIRGLALCLLPIICYSCMHNNNILLWVCNQEPIIVCF